jgi:hypothetical protein
MDPPQYKVYYAALRSLEFSQPTFLDRQREAIAEAIAVAVTEAIGSIELTVIPPAKVPHHEHVVEKTNGHTHKLST